MSVPDLTNYGIATVQTIFARTIFNDENIDGIDISTQNARLQITAGTTMALTSTDDMILSSGLFDLEASENAIIETTNGTLSLLASNLSNGKIIINAEEGIDLVTTEQDINIGITTGDLNISSDKILLKTDSTAIDSVFINSAGGIDLTSILNNIDITTISGIINLVSGNDISLSSTGTLDITSNDIIGITGTSNISINTNSTTIDALLLNSSGGIDIFSAAQAIDVISSGSNVNVSSTNNDITLNTPSGDISLGATGGNISIGSTANITLTTIDNDITLASANKISINSSSTVADSLFLNSSGGVDVTSVTGDIDIINTSGNLNTTTNGNLNMTTTGGDITIGSTSIVDITSGNGANIGITSANILYLTSNSAVTDSLNLLSLGGINSSATGKILFTSNSTDIDSFFINSLGGIDLTSNINNIDIITNSGDFNAQITGTIDIDSLNGSLNLGSTSSLNMICSTLMKLNSGSTTSIDANKVAIGTTNTADDSLTFLSRGGSNYTVENGNYDIGITGQLNIDVSRNLSHIRNWADSDGDDLEICVKNLGITSRNASLILSSEGTGSDAIKINATEGGIDVDSVGLISIQTTDNINGIEIGNNPGVPVTIGGNSTSTLLPGNLTVQGNLTVNGITTTVNSTTVTVDDKNIELNSITSPTDTNADGGGITIKGTTDKIIAYNNTSTACTSASFQISEDIDLGTTTKQYTIQQNRALSHNALFINSTLNINSTDGGVYYNKQDNCNDTSGDWRVRVISGVLTTEHYDGASWITKCRLTA